MPAQDQLSRRERQIMDVLYRRGEASVADVLADLADAPSDSALRALLRILERKGHVSRRAVDRSFVYRPALSIARARVLAVRHLVETFFAGSRARATQAILSDTDIDLPPKELARLIQLIERAETDTP
jgi:BlaI family transcriptional regulator, penicillinase repressor